MSVLNSSILGQLASIDATLVESITTTLASTSPYLIGVRHHSAMLARAMPALLESFAPESVLIELPSDLADWIDHLAHPETVAPVAISAIDPLGNLFFYPLADFSPELAAIRWARERDIPVVACDLSVAAKAMVSLTIDPTGSQQDVDVLDRLLAQTGDSDTGQLWQRLVESPGCNADPESLRSAALLFGCVVRKSTAVVSDRDQLREAAMRQAIREAPKHSVAVVGSFHAAALVPELIESLTEQDAKLLKSANDVSATQDVGVSLIPYSFDQLDERSGYPAGVLDPIWHQRMLEAADNQAMDGAAVGLATSICRKLRGQGHVAGTPDATEAIRVMRDLARLRGLATPGRGEFVQAIETCLVQGDLMGRGRAVAAASGAILVGSRYGAVSPDTPRCGLAVSLEEEFQKLGLPGPDSMTRASQTKRSSSRTVDAGKELRLDVLRNPRDRARAVVFRRLCAVSIPYARRVDETGIGHRENLIERWEVQWQQGTSATIESLARHGVTLMQVVEAIVRSAGQDHSEGHDGAKNDLPETLLNRMRIATQCGLIRLTQQSIAEVDQSFRNVANLSQLVEAVTILTRVRAGHLPGLPQSKESAYPPIVEVFRLPDSFANVSALLRACLDRLDGMEGSNDASDVEALIDLTTWFTSDLSKLVSDQGDSDTASPDFGIARLLSWCRNTVRRGSDRMRGAAAGSLCVMEDWSADQFGRLTRGWLDAAVDREGRNRLTQAIAGATQVLLSHMQSDPVWLGAIEDGVIAASDERFLNVLPALRGGFQDVSPADRNRLLEMRLTQIDERGSSISATGFAAEHQADPEWLADEVARLRRADLAGREAVLVAFPEIQSVLEQFSRGEEVEEPTSTSRRIVAGEISLADRWRLIFGLPPNSNAANVLASARSLDQLFGRGRGEGSRGQLGKRASGTGGGTEAPQPTTAQWAEELEALFGSEVCQEVLGQSAAAGRSSALTLLDPDSVTPSVDLLQQVLQMAGAMPESKTARLRKLAKRITEQLAKELAVRLQPALHGLSTPRPSRRKSRNLSLPRTIRDNLRNCHRNQDGRTRVVAERMIFNSPARREMDWHLTFVVDVSGSMDASVIYSALVAAIFDALPALSVRFLAFSTEVIDFSDQVGDPLSLLLEVQVGGGTDIGLGLRAARAGIKVPSRSIVVLVSDFEEGTSVGGMIAEVRALADAGVKCIGLASLDDHGVARFHQGYAQMVAAAGMPVAAVSPDKLAQWVGQQIRK